MSYELLNSFTNLYLKSYLSSDVYKFISSTQVQRNKIEEVIAVWNKFTNLYEVEVAIKVRPIRQVRLQNYIQKVISIQFSVYKR